MNRSNLKNRLVIGSANFSQKYGSQKFQIKLEEIKKILNLAKKNQILKIDTATNYLKNKNIFKNIDKKFKFYTKVIPDYKWASYDYCKEQLDYHFKSFNNNEVETLLFHDIKILFTKNGSKIFKNLEILKKEKYFKKIGLSIYDTSCMNYIISNYNIDLVQCPYNILDKRIISTGWYEKLKTLNKEIHVRSIFLQGLLVNNLFYKRNNFKRWKKNFLHWFNFLKDKKISPIDYCLSDLLNYDFDQIIIGINSSENLKKIVNFKKINKNKMINFNINDTKLIDPRKWK